MYIQPALKNTSFEAKKDCAHKKTVNYASLPLGNVYGIKIHNQLSFKGYYGENNAINKLYYVLTGEKEPKTCSLKDEVIWIGAGHANNKKWLGSKHPKDALTQPVSKAIEDTLALCEGGSLDTIPKNIKTPFFPSNWGRHANYIEINPRALAKMEGDSCSEGILGAIKMLPLIPPSGKNFANCIVVSQLYPNIYGDGWNKPNWEENSLYGIKLDKWDNYGISHNISSWNLERNGVKLNPQEQIKAFNDLAHLRGLKTGFRMLISEDQLRIGNDEVLRWDNPRHVEAFIEACVDGIDMGFDCIYFDSMRHVGGYDPYHYAGVGKTPEYHQMAYILHEIRQRTGRDDLSFVGEKCDADIERYKNMGLTAGTDYSNANNLWEVKRNTNQLAYSKNYAPGPEVSNDNDCGWASYEERLNKMNNCLFGYDNVQDKLPTYMQMHDIFPLKNHTNTHDLMLHNPRFSSDGNPEEHWCNLFEDNNASRDYTKKVFEKFAWALGK